MKTWMASACSCMSRPFWLAPPSTRSRLKPLPPTSATIASSTSRVCAQAGRARHKCLFMQHMHASVLAGAAVDAQQAEAAAACVGHHRLQHLPRLRQSRQGSARPCLQARMQVRDAQQAEAAAACVGHHRLQHLPRLCQSRQGLAWPCLPSRTCKQHGGEHKG